MKQTRTRSIFLIVCILVLSTACVIGGQTPASDADIQAAVDATLTAMGNGTVAPDPATEPPPANPVVQGTTVSCGNLTLIIPTGLGSVISCEEVPEENQADMPGMGVHPAYYELTIRDYTLQGHFFTALIDVFPVPRFIEMVGDPMSNRVAFLQGFIGGGIPDTDALPLLPFFNAAQMFHAQYSTLAFTNGSGIRFITMYSQAYLPVNNNELFYTFQGLTSDNQYWVSAILPTTYPGLPDNSDNPPGGDWNTFATQFETYIADTTMQLNANDPNGFNPSLIALDTMISTISIAP
ncbi:MAG TPA: hypothetical protein VN376_10185 [Longilinea sp.]|nr:hypothetical protein [Longilinea sp.]